MKYRHDGGFISLMFLPTIGRVTADAVSVDSIR